MEVLYHIRPYFVGIFPYIGLKNRPKIYGIGTSNESDPESWPLNKPTYPTSPSTGNHSHIFLLKPRSRLVVGWSKKSAMWRCYSMRDDLHNVGPVMFVAFFASNWRFISSIFPSMLTMLQNYFNQLTVPIASYCFLEPIRDTPMDDHWIVPLWLRKPPYVAYPAWSGRESMAVESHHSFGLAEVAQILHG